MNDECRKSNGQKVEELEKWKESAMSDELMIIKWHAASANFMSETNKFLLNFASVSELITTVWQLYDYRMTTVWPPYDYRMTTVWPPYDHWMTTEWQYKAKVIRQKAKGRMKDAGWMSNGERWMMNFDFWFLIEWKASRNERKAKRKARKLLNDNRMTTVWLPYDHWMTTQWPLNDHRMTTEWLLNFASASELIST